MYATLVADDNAKGASSGVEGVTHTHTHIQTNTCMKSDVALCELLEEIKMSFDKTSTRNQQQAAKMSSECSTTN